MGSSDITAVNFFISRLFKTTIYGHQSRFSISYIHFQLELVLIYTYTFTYTQKNIVKYISMYFSDFSQCFFKRCLRIVSHTADSKKVICLLLRIQLNRKLALNF